MVFLQKMRRHHPRRGWEIPAALKSRSDMEGWVRSCDPVFSSYRFDPKVRKAILGYPRKEAPENILVLFQ